MNWLTLSNPQDVDSPGLLIDPDRVSANIERMIAAVGGPDHTRRLRPHLKTHKMARVVRMQLDAGINRFKAATMAEAEMAALLARHPQHKLWPGHNIFFGGAHTLMRDGARVWGVGDPLRGGVCHVVAT